MRVGGLTGRSFCLKFSPGRLQFAAGVRAHLGVVRIQSGTIAALAQMPYALRPDLSCLAAALGIRIGILISVAGS